MEERYARLGLDIGFVKSARRRFQMTSPGEIVGRSGDRTEAAQRGGLAECVAGIAKEIAGMRNDLATAPEIL